MAVAFAPLVIWRLAWEGTDRDRTRPALAPKAAKVSWELQRLKKFPLAEPAGEPAGTPVCTKPWVHSLQGWGLEGRREDHREPGAQSLPPSKCRDAPGVCTWQGWGPRGQECQGSPCRNPAGAGELRVGA